MAVAVSEPAMVEGVDPVTRLRIADEALGCAMLTVLSCPIENPCQLTTALWLDCVMVSSVDDDCAIAAVPTATLPPGGRLCASAEPMKTGLVSAVVASSNATRTP